ncbi:MAG: 23S rRNA (guanosine(2251)-2'-O)-methyltransferase RlmB [Polyangia bacterium]
MKRVLAGPNAVSEALRASPGAISLVCLAAGLQPTTARRLGDLTRRVGIEIETVQRSFLDRLAKGLVHQGVVALSGDYPYAGVDDLLREAVKLPRPLLVLLDQVQDPRNLGAVIRSAHALGAAGMVLTRNRSAPVTAAAVRVSAGASELMRIARVTNLARLIERLDEEGYRVLGADAAAETPVHRAGWEGGPSALVLGNEQRGLRRLTRERCHALFSIPLETGFDSLNVSAAAAIALWEATRAARRS